MHTNRRGLLSSGSTSDAENPVINVYGTTQEEGWLVRSWTESYHENEKLTELREGDVVPHLIPVEVYLLSKNGLASAEVRSVFCGENGSTRIVSTPLENHGARIRVPSISDGTNLSVVAVYMQGNILEKLVNITVHTGIPFGPHG